MGGVNQNMKEPAPFIKPIYVTRPSLPSLDDLRGKLESIWECGIVTDMGSQRANKVFHSI